MTITYRTKVKIRHIVTIVSAVLGVIMLAWICWVIWAARYVVYTQDGAEIVFEEQNMDAGVPATEPKSEGSVSIYYNEGSDAVQLSSEMTSLTGYYISYDDLNKDLVGTSDTLDVIPAGTPIMIELKGGYGSFYYSTNVSEAVTSASVSITGVDELIEKLQSKNYYLIAKISAFRDYNYGLNHVSSGLPLVGKLYLWSDDGGYYWLKPNDTGVLSYLTSIILELRDMGFNEVMLGDFRFPNSTEYSFSGDKSEALQFAVQTLMDSCSADDFVLSFSTGDVTFPLPDGRSRIYLENVDAANVENIASQAVLTDPETRLVFVSDNNDTRFENYSVLRPISVAEALEEQKADMNSSN